MGDKPGHICGTYLRIVAAQVRSQAQYRVSFGIELAMLSLFGAMDLIQVFVLFRVTDALGGFNLLQVLFIGAMATCGFTLADTLVGNVERVKFYVRTGSLDAMLIRPRRVLPQLLLVDFEFRRVVRTLFHCGVLVVVAANLDVQWVWWKMLTLIAAPLLATLFFAAVFIATATVAFWWIESGEFANSFTYGGQQFTQYPINVYGDFIRGVFAFALGFGFVGYYPALLILDVADPLGMPAWFAAGSPLVAAIATTVAWAAWRTGIRHYKGTGS